MGASVGAWVGTSVGVTDVGLVENWVTVTKVKGLVVGASVGALVGAVVGAEVTAVAGASVGASVTWVMVWVWVGLVSFAAAWVGAVVAAGSSLFLQLNKDKPQANTKIIAMVLFIISPSIQDLPHNILPDIRLIGI